MEQRRLRLGDILDDYCPRERRVTNHAVVAMVDEDVKQTRCTTCDAEHAYKGAKVPRRRKKEAPSALYKEVLAGMPETEAGPVLTGPSNGHGDPAPPAADSVEAEDVSATDETDESALNDETEAPLTAAPADPADDAELNPEESISDVPPEEGPVHRRLIRATLPRPEGQKDVRPVPEFTIRQPGGGRGNGNFRGDVRTKSLRPGQGANGNRAQQGHRFGGNRPGPGRGSSGRGGQSAGFRGQGQPRQGGGRKRSR